MCYLCTFCAATMNFTTGSFFKKKCVFDLIIIPVYFIGFSYSLLVFMPNSAPITLANLLWVVTTTDHILKLVTVLFKGILTAIPIGVFPVSRRVSYSVLHYGMFECYTISFIAFLGKMFRFHWKIFSSLPSSSSSTTMDSLSFNQSVYWKFEYFLLWHARWSLFVRNIFNL